MNTEILRNPITGETARVIESTDEVLKMEIVLPPNCGMASEHFHPDQEQITYVQSGELHYTLNGKENVLSAGNAVRINAGVSHALWNPTGIEVRIVEELRPARRLHDFFRIFFALLDEDKENTTDGFLMTTALFWEFRDSARPSPFLLRSILLLLAPVVKLFGYQKKIQLRTQELRKTVA